MFFSCPQSSLYTCTSQQFSDHKGLHTVLQIRSSNTDQCDIYIRRERERKKWQATLLMNIDKGQPLQRFHFCFYSRDFSALLFYFLNIIFVVINLNFIHFVARSNVLNCLSDSAFNKPLCEVLLNQKYFNGIGNYLRAEICFR